MRENIYNKDDGLTEGDFSDYFDIEKMQRLQNAVSKNQDIASLILDTEGNNITKPTRFSVGLIRIVKRNKKVDDFFDQGLMKQYKENVRTAAVVRNKTGDMMSGCIPIIINDRKVATWIVGGVFDEEMMLSREKYEQLAKDAGEEVDKFMEAIDDVHIMSKSEFLGIFEVVRLVAEQMAENLDKNLAQKIELAYKQELMDELEETNVALKIQAERYRLLSECSDEIIFDYDADTDTLTVPLSSKTGIASDWILTDFLAERKFKKYIHPDEEEAFERAFDDMYSAARDEQFEMRLKIFSTEYSWYRLNIVFFKDDSMKLIRIIGRIQNIEKEKEELLELESQIKKDPMTGLLNKAATQLSVEKFLRSTSPGTSHALLIIDIDDFKNVNDTFGHLFGDMVIENVAASISSAFRKSDIIGRIGGDEFLVLMKHTGRRIAEIKARDFNKAVRRTYSHEDKKMDITCSIGIAFYGRDAGDYEELFKKADIAMYNAKLEGKNTVVVYDTDKEQLFEEISKEDGRSPRNSAEFDADLISVAFGLLFESREIDTSIKILTERIADKYSIQKIIYNYSQVNHKDQLMVWNSDTNRFVGRSEDDYEDYSVAEKELREQKLVVINDCSKEKKAAEVAAYGTKIGMSALIGMGFPLKDGVMEYIIFANTDAPRCWTEFERKTFEQVAEIFVLFARLRRERENNKAAIRKLNLIDDVTGLYNRSGFENKALEIMEEKGSDYRYIMEYIDIDNFSYVNENFGIKVGDEILNNVADILKSYRHSTVARIYGDHFIAFFCIEKGKDFDPVATFREQADFFRQQQKSLLTSGRLKLTAGIYEMDPKERNISRAIDNANTARKQAKNDNGLYYSFFDKEMQEKKAHERLIADSFEQALEKQAFELFLQPKIGLATGTAVGAEGLVRWRLPDGSYRLPGDFIGVLEKYNFIQQMDFAMLEAALKIIEGWSKEGLEPIPISINFSKYNSNSPDFVQKIMNMCKQYNVPKRYIEIEINENALAADKDILYENLKSLKKKGFTVAIDNFGSGVASLGSLIKAPIDIVKVDRMFITELEGSPAVRDYISNMCTLISSVKKQIIFEGVETKEQADFLYSCGIIAAQGYLYGHPEDAETFAKKYLTF